MTGLKRFLSKPLHPHSAGTNHQQEFSRRGGGLVASFLIPSLGVLLILLIIGLGRVVLQECLCFDGRFCRATMHSEEFHVFAFAEAGEQPLVAYAAYPAGRLGEILTAD